MDEREKRHARQFEPPPWEQAAFDEFQRLKSEREQEVALQEALKAAMAPVEAVEGVEGVEAEATTTDETPVLEAEQVAGIETEVVPTLQMDVQHGVSSAALETMLIGLKSQEPRVAKNFKLIANVASALLTAGGLGFVVWAAVLFAGVGPDAGITPTLASLLLMVWGFLLIAGAGLLFKKYNLT